MVFLLNCSWIIVLALKVIKVNNYVLNIILNEKSLPHITPKVMVKLKLLTKSIRVSYPKLLQNMVKIGMYNSLMFCRPIEKV